MPTIQSGWLMDSMAWRTNLHGERKFLGESSDHTSTMLDSGTMIVLITSIAAAICALSLYSVYGNVIRHETTLHDLRNRVEKLQNHQTLHLAELKGEIAPEIALEAMELPAEDEEIAAETEDQFDAELVSSSTNAA